MYLLDECSEVESAKSYEMEILKYKYLEIVFRMTLSNTTLH